MNEDELFFVGQKAFIEKEGELLIITIPKIGLDFPGGKISEGEKDLTDSLKREVREETGLEIEVGSPFVTWWTASRKFPGKRILLIGHHCQYLSGEIKLSDEYDHFRWINKNNYDEIEKNNYTFVLEKYFEMK